MLLGMQSASADEFLTQLLKHGIYDVETITESYEDRQQMLKWFFEKSFESREEAKQRGATLGIPVEGIMVQAGYERTDASFKQFQRDVNSGRFFEQNTSWSKQISTKKISREATKIIIEYIRNRAGVYYYAKLDADDPKAFEIVVNYTPISADKPTAKIVGVPQKSRTVSFGDDWPETIGPQGFRMLCEREDESKAVKVILNFDVKSSGEIKIPPFHDPPSKPPMTGQFSLQNPSGSKYDDPDVGHLGWGYHAALGNEGTTHELLRFWGGQGVFFPNLKWKQGWDVIEKIDVKLGERTVAVLHNEADFKRLRNEGVPELRHTTEHPGATHGLHYYKDQGINGAGLYFEYFPPEPHSGYSNDVAGSRRLASESMRVSILYEGQPLYAIAKRSAANGKPLLVVTAFYKDGTRENLRVK